MPLHFVQGDIARPADPPVRPLPRQRLPLSSTALWNSGQKFELRVMGAGSARRAALTGNLMIGTVVTYCKSGPPPGERSQFSRLLWTR